MYTNQHLIFVYKTCNDFIKIFNYFIRKSQFIFSVQQNALKTHNVKLTFRTIPTNKKVFYNEIDIIRRFLMYN